MNIQAPNVSGQTAAANAARSERAANDAVINARFDQFVFTEPNTGCWLWGGVLGGEGYGYFWRRGRKVIAHRVSHERFIGPIPRGLAVDHKCRVRCCVNPLHLEAVSDKENVRRALIACPDSHKRTACKNGHPLTDESVTGSSRQCRICKLARDNISRRARRSCVAMEAWS